MFLCSFELLFRYISRVQHLHFTLHFAAGLKLFIQHILLILCSSSHSSITFTRHSAHFHDTESLAESIFRPRSEMVLQHHVCILWHIYYSIFPSCLHNFEALSEISNKGISTSLNWAFYNVGLVDTSVNPLQSYNLPIECHGYLCNVDLFTIHRRGRKRACCLPGNRN